MGGALQAIARSSPARGARVGGGREKGRRRATRKSRGQSQEGGVGTVLLHLTHMTGLSA